MQRMPGRRTPRFVASLLTLGLCSALGACSSSSGGSSYSQYFKVVREAWRAQFSDGAVTREQAASVAFASMGWRLDGSAEHLIVLATDTGGEQLWTSAERIVLVTRDGRILRTVGLPKDLAATTADPTRNQSPAAALAGPLQTSRQQDFPDMNHYAVTIHCRAFSRGPDPITILGASIATTRVEESCAAQGLDWRFTDTFWIDPQSGLSWKTIQHIHPGGTVIQTEIFRPPG
jgi:hypothetical protein